MAKHYLLSLIALALFSCGPGISYIGTSHKPTQQVDVFVDETAITRHYTIAGKGYVSYLQDRVPESLQAMAVAKARQKGADAILVKDYFVPVTTAGVSVAGRSDSLSRNVLALSPQSSSSGVVILFLKYKEK